VSPEISRTAVPPLSLEQIFRDGCPIDSPTRSETNNDVESTVRGDSKPETSRFRHQREDPDRSMERLANSAEVRRCRRRRHKRIPSIFRRWQRMASSLEPVQHILSSKSVPPTIHCWYMLYLDTKSLSNRVTSS